MRATATTTATALFLVTAVATAGAQSNAALMANDHYTRSHDYDLIHQRIVVGEFNWDSTSFEGEATSMLTARRAGLDSVIFDEGALLVNTKVTDRAGATLRTTRHGDTLVVFPQHPLPFGDTLTFTVQYHAKVHSGDGLTWIRSDGLAHRPEQIWSQGEDHNNHDWFPTYDFPNDKMTWELVATVPSADQAISNGRLVSNVTNGRTRTMTWRQESPSATYLVSLVVAPLAEIHDTWQNVPLMYFTYHEDSVRAWPLFHETADMIDTYSRLTGIRYPWAKYSETTVADFFGGMENVSATTLVDWLPDGRAYADRPWYKYILIPHELAHQWFGDYVTTINWANMWLNEGFAEFMPGQYWGAKLGTHAEQDYYDDEVRQFRSLEDRRSMPLASLGSNNIYPKGALVLEMLKHYLGPERFWASIHRYLTDHAYGNATSDDLRQAVLEATGENLDWFWNEWVYDTGLPHFTVTAAWDSVHATVTLAVHQTQTDTLHADSTGLKFTVPQVFRMPVTVRVGMRDKDVVQHAMLDQRDQTIAITGVTTDPTMVIFDDGNGILKTLDFDQPTYWLANQLRKDDDLWDRDWAMAQLARRTADGAAITALTEAATHADYYLTREHAVVLLGQFPTAVALPTLLTALHDTLSQVRTAAATSIGHAGGEGALAALTTAFGSDTSYDVRAAAVGAIARIDRDHMHDILTRALAMPSYQEGIQNAALTAAAQLGDTAVTSQVDSMIALNALPAEVLAVFGMRGNSRAMDLLMHHVNDERAGVRRWVVDAIRDVIGSQNKPLAIQQLQAAANIATHADTKAAIAGALVALGRP